MFREPPTAHQSVDIIEDYRIKSMMKRPLVNVAILVFSFFFAVSCSSLREVSVVSHGDEVPAVKKAELEEVVVLASPALVVVQEPARFPETPPIPAPSASLAAPINPSLSSASVKTAMDTDIFAQSAEDSALPWTLEDVFFDFDQMAIRRDAMPILEENAKILLSRYANREVLIQGHCDERGTEAYNFILGERRATAVKNYLVDLGVPATQIRVISLGKNQPFCLQRTLPCLRLNRRAHFVLK